MISIEFVGAARTVTGSMHRARGRLRKIAMVHGEPKAQAALRDALTARGFDDIVAPEAGDRLEM